MKLSVYVNKHNPQEIKCANSYACQWSFCRHACKHKYYWSILMFTSVAAKWPLAGIAVSSFDSLWAVFIYIDTQLHLKRIATFGPQVLPYAWYQITSEVKCLWVVVLVVCTCMCYEICPMYKVLVYEWLAAFTLFWSLVYAIKRVAPILELYVSISLNYIRAIWGFLDAYHADIL